MLGRRNSARGYYRVDTNVRDEQKVFQQIEIHPGGPGAGLNRLRRCVQAFRKGNVFLEAAKMLGACPTGLASKNAAPMPAN